MESNSSDSAAAPPPEQLYYTPVPADLTKYTILQVNGTRTNKALDWGHEPEPPTSCELYVKNIPKRFKGEDLWPLFERFGRIFNIRVLMDYNDSNRGFAYVKFARESQATLAMELVNYVFVFPGFRLNVQRSGGKSRLIANHLPKNVPVSVIHEKLKEIFPTMRDFFMPTAPGVGEPPGSRTPFQGLEPGALHRGFAFLEFGTHHEAVAAKQYVYTGVLEIWGAQVKIGWARPHKFTPEEDDQDYYPRLFIRPIHAATVPQFIAFLTQHGVNMNTVVRFDQRKTNGILKVLTVHDGEEIKRLVVGKEFSGHKLDVQWFRERNSDARRYCYCKSLELMCTANQWSMPVILFGRIFPDRCEQYVALFTTFRGHIFSVFVKVALNSKMDMTSRIAETFLALIEDTGYLPSYNYVVELEDNTVRVVGFVDEEMTLTRTYKAGDSGSNFYWVEMMELNWAIQKLARIHPRYLYEKYQDAIDNAIVSKEGQEQYVVEGLSTNNRIFCSVYYDQTNMTLLLLCDKFTQSNKNYVGGAAVMYSTTKAAVCYGKHPQTFKLSQFVRVKNEEKSKENW